MKRLLFILLLSACCTAIAAPIRSMLGADGAEIITDDWSPTAADYIQDGLVAMWDAIENGGYGIHDPAATHVKDLVGDRDLPCAAGSVSDSWVRYSNTYSITATTPLISGYDFTISGVFDRSETTGNFCAIGFGFWTSRLVVGSPTTFGCRFASAYYNKSSKDVVSSVTWRRGSNDSSTVRFFDGSVDKGLFKGVNSGDVSTLKDLNINGENPYGNYRNIFSLGNLRIYDRALTPTEIRYNYLIDKERFGL